MILQERFLCPTAWVTKFLGIEVVKSALGDRKGIEFKECSAIVEKANG